MKGTPLPDVFEKKWSEYMPRPTSIPVATSHITAKVISLVKGEIGALVLPVLARERGADDLEAEAGPSEIPGWERSPHAIRRTRWLPESAM